MNYKAATISIVVVSLSISDLTGQDLGSLSIKKGIGVTGTLAFNSIATYTQMTTNTREPFNWYVSANINVDLFGYNAPFSFNYSNASRSYTQPFNRFSFAPQYKWVKTYIGYSTLTFSPFTLAGHTFLGGGIELSPGNWKVMAMYGKLRDAIGYNLSDSLQHVNASYRRMGYGVKVAYDSHGGSMSANIFFAHDDPASLPFVLPGHQLTPQQNVATSIQFRKRIAGKLSIEGEYGVSVLNGDVRSNAVSDTVVSSLHFIGGLLPENTSQRYYDAINGSIAFDAASGSLRLKYEQVAPEYQTLGGYYFNNDVRALTVAPVARLLRNKLILQGNAGVQQNNLDRTRRATSLRFAGTINASYLPNERWNISGMYTNLRAYTTMRPPTDPFINNHADTLNFYQITENANTSIVWTKASGKKQRVMIISGGYQQAVDHYGSLMAQPSRVFTVNTSYSTSNNGDFLFALTGNYYVTITQAMVTAFRGPGMNISKTCLKKTLRCTLSSAFNDTSMNGTRGGPVLSNRVALNYSPQQPNTKTGAGHHLTASIHSVNRFTTQTERAHQTEITVTVSYSSSF